MQTYLYKCPGSTVGQFDKSLSWDSVLVDDADIPAMRKQGWHRSIAEAWEMREEPAAAPAPAPAVEPEPVAPAELPGLAEAVAAGFRDDKRWSDAKRAEKLAEWKAAQ